MKYLVIAEKPSVARSISKVIGAYKHEDGYLEGGDCVVSWCLGHLAEYAAPEYYDNAIKAGGLMIFRFSRKNGNCWFRKIRKRISISCESSSEARILIMW